MIILASASPRRQELLQQLGYEFIVQVSHAEEVMDNSFSPENLVKENARRKAVDVAKQNTGKLVLGADTVVAIDGKILGKPKDKADAKAMLKMLENRAHTVSTGICAAIYENDTEKIWQDVVTTEVHFGPMTEKEIDTYIATGEPMDKAGAYGIQGKAAAYISGISGSYSNVVGLPLYQVRKLLQEITK